MSTSECLPAHPGCKLTHAHFTVDKRDFIHHTLTILSFCLYVCMYVDKSHSFAASSFPLLRRCNYPYVECIAEHFLFVVLVDKCSMS